MGMDVCGVPGFPIPRPFPVLHQPRPAPRVALAGIDLVQVQVTRPRGRAFAVSVSVEGFPPPDADVVAGFVLYGAEAGDVARLLEEAWAARSLEPVIELRAPYYLRYRHPRFFGTVLGTIEALQESFLP